MIMNTTLAVSPLRILRSLAFRMRHINPHDLIPGIIEHQADRATGTLHACARETGGIESGLHRAATRLHAALTDKATPGIVTPEEARGIARTLVTTKGRAATVRQKLENLAQ